VNKSNDRELGMHRSITRRDFLNGVALTAGAALLPSPLLAMLEEAEREKAADYYPPALTGLRGSHPGSFEVAHQLRDGSFWDSAGKPIDTGEQYDLVIVGGGISGLAAAHYFRKAAGEKARILILDNHDDFGGHAKRNEFTVGNRHLLGYGGTFSIESPAPYSTVAKALVEELGIDVPGFAKIVDRNLYRSQGLSPHFFFDKETFGSDRLVVDPQPLVGSETGDLTVTTSEPWKKFMAEAPLSEKARKDFARLHKERKDYLPGLSSNEKKTRLVRMSTTAFMNDVIGLDPQVAQVYQAAPHPLFGVGVDAVSALDAWGLGFPGFAGMNLDPAPGKGMNRDAIRNDEADRYFFHFPDGNASIARLLVRRLIPGVIPGNSVTDVVTARANYAKLDDASSPVRVRLNSTAVKVKHVGDPAAAKQVEVDYVNNEKLHTVRGKSCILACWHVVIPYLCEEMPDTQKEALASAAKVPIVYTNVVVRNWNSFKKLGANYIYAPGSYFTHMTLDLPVSIGEYHCPKSPDEPIVIHMVKTPCRPGLPAREQHRRGRIELFSTTYENFERKIRDEMARALGPGGFDPARDIAAITVNRWPHGYAYEYNALFDKFWLEGGETPCEVARKPFGRVAIANSDAGAYAYTDCAIDHGYRAVQEVLKRA
jgi:spermidine dehydrogenase